MGAVYEATDTRSGRTAAVKLLSSDHLTHAGRRRFEREARAMMSVHHPHVCAAYDFGLLDDGRLYLAMERLDGEDVFRRLKRDGRFSASLAVRIALGSARGLAAAHAMGLVHRDVKPSNLFLTRSGPDSEEGAFGEVKVLDFGLAIFSLGEARVTRTGEIVGTPGYMAPEQARGERVEDGRTDVFSLAAVLYRMLAGFPPFGPYGSEPAIAVVVRMLTEPARDLAMVAPNLPAPLCKLVMRALSVDMKHRPADMTRFADDLETLLSTLGDDEGVWLELADTGQVRYDDHTLVEEQRLVTAMLAGGVTDVQTVVEVIRRHGGRAAELGTGRVVGLFGADALDGDEAGRAVAAAIEAQGAAEVIGIGTARTELGEGGVSGDALTVAEAGVADRSGIIVDETTRAHLGRRLVTQEGKIIRLEDAVTSDARLRFVGRSADMADLGARIERAFDDEESGGVLLLGAAGVGKTRLVQELTEHIREQFPGALILCGRGESNRRFSSWHALGRALRLHAGLAEDTPAARCIEVMCNVAEQAGLERARGYFLAAAIGVPIPAGVSELTDNARREPRAMRDQVISTVGDLIEAHTDPAPGSPLQARPVVLALEDAHWADSPSLELVDILFRRLERAPFFALMTGRPHAVEERPELFDSPHLVRRDLRDLSRKAAATLARDALGSVASDVGEEVISTIAEHSGGNPFFVIEIVSSIEHKIRRFGRDGFDPGAFVLPLTVEAAVQSRIGHLPRTDKDTLKRAAVFGERFWREAIEPMVPEVAASLQRLWRGGLIRRPARRDVRLADYEEYEFKHRVVREVAYGMLTPDQQRGLHLSCGRWLADVGASPGEAAEHLTVGGDIAQASLLWEAAAREAAGGGDPGGAIERYGRALEGATGSDRAVNILLERARLATGLGRYELVETDLSALEEHQPLKDDQQWAQSLLLRGRLLRVRQRDPRGEYSLLEQAAALYERCGEQRGLSNVLASMAISQLYGGLGDGLALSQRALETAGEDRHASARARASMGIVYIHKSSLDEASRVENAAVEDARAAGDLQLAIDIQGDLGYVELTRGDFQAAVTVLQEVVDGARRIGAAKAAGYGWHNLGLALLRAGRVDEALAAEDKALVLAATHENDRLAGYAQVYRALVLLEKGDLVAAESAAQSAGKVAGAIDNKPDVRTVLALIHHAAGRVDAGLAEAEKAREIREQNGSMLEHEAELFWVQSELLRASGRVAEADSVAAEGWQRVLARADQVASTPEDRERFLTAFPVHRGLRAAGAPS